jgi:flagellar hook-associated protein 2
MGTITMTGYNNIDWTTVLNAVMSQEKQPFNNMQAQYTTMQLQSSNYATLATKLGTLQSKIDDLKSSTGFTGRTASSTDSGTVSIAADSSAAVGAYDVVVHSLARSQVTASTTTVSSKDTVVASGGSVTINGKNVTLTGDTTMQQLADAINGTDGVGVAATVVSANGAFRLVLTAADTGKDHAFTVTNNLQGTVGNVDPASGGAQFAFNGTPAVAASDADIEVNNVEVTSTSNTFSDVIPGATLTVLRKNELATTVSVLEDTTATKAKLQAFVSAFNDLASFYTDQAASAKAGAAYSLAHDSLTRSLRYELNSTLLASIDGTGAFSNLSEVGLEFQRDGTLSLNESTFDDAAKSNLSDLQALFAGTGSTDGIFDQVSASIGNYTQAGGLVADAQTRLNDTMSALNDRMSAEQSRLDMRKLQLQQEYAAADSAIATLNSQASSLSSLGVATK